MYLMSICNNADILAIIRLAKIAITILRIVVPIILILSLMINYLSAVKDNDSDMLSKANKSAVTKIIAALLVFMIPTFINILADLSSVGSNTYTSCLKKANSGYISELIVSEAKTSLSLAGKSLTRNDYNLALSRINKVKDSETKASLLSELKSVEEAIKKKEEEEKKKKEEEAERNRQEQQQQREQEQQYYSGPTNFSPGVSGNVDNVMGIVYYNQCDSRWGNIEYDTGGGNGANGHATLCSSSCGYTSFAMIAAGMNNNLSINPYSVIKYMRNISDGELTHRGRGAAGWDEVAGNGKVGHYNLSVQDISRGQVESSLKTGHPVLILVPGHYMVLSYSSRGYYVLLDPFTGWGDKNKKSGEYKSVSDIEAIYGNIQRAAAYTKK